jgi:transglutaminase-like putative cysteine protease
MNTKNLFKALAAVAVLATKAFGAFDLGTPASSTPYEPYMAPVKNVLGGLNGKAEMGKVKELLKVGYGFRYSFTEPYLAASPEQTAKTKTGDCKAKSLWLISQMGDRNVRYIIGKARSTSKISHAWVMWNDGGKWWILDPTNVSRPIAADSVGKNEYIPLYSYDTGHAFRHSATTILTASAANGQAPVAGR